MEMEKLLKSLFDFQRYEQNPELASVIDDVERRYGIIEMTDDELNMLAAAGDPFDPPPDGKKKDGGA